MLLSSCHLSRVALGKSGEQPGSVVVEYAEELFGTRDRGLDGLAHRLRLVVKGRALAQLAEELLESRVQRHLASVCGEQGCSGVAEPAAELF